MGKMRKTLGIITIVALLAGSVPLMTQPVAAADGEGQDLPPIELPEKGHPKLDSQLNQLVSAEIQKQADRFAQQSNIELVDGNVRVIVECLLGQVDTAIEAAGALGVVETSYRNLLQVVVPIPQLTALADTPAIRFVRLPRYAQLYVISEGAALINADDWQAAGYTGAGIKVAILDGGFTGYADLLGTELPASVTTQSFYAGSDIEGDTDHGTACAEIVYDITPDAQFYLVNFGTDVELGNAVDWLIAQRVDVISFSMGDPIGGPGDGTGLSCEMVDDARTAGILWVSAIGNYAQRHWQGDFLDTNSDSWHEFYSDDISNAIWAEPGDRITVGLKWDDTWGSSDNDYDLALIDPYDTLVAASVNLQYNAYNDPIEWLAHIAEYSGYYHIVITSWASDETANFHLYSYYHDLQYQVVSSSFCIPADSPNAMAVGAVPWDNPTTLESFSSQGPTKDNRIKPDLVALDRVSTVTFSSFWGTSASAPHAASAAVLVKQRYPSYTPAEIQAFLESRAVDLGAIGKDNLFGSGRLDLGSLAVTTNAADNITADSVILHGSLPSLGPYSSANVSFKWGTISGALDQETTPEAMTSTGAFSDNLSGLLSNATYYFRAKATGSVTVYGDELSFTTEPASYDILLYSGWNLISLPLIPESQSIEDVLAGISVDGVAAYDGATQEWYLYSPGAPSDLTEMTHGKGYWVKVTSPCTLTIEGTVPSLPYDIPLFAGWNLIGLPLIPESQSIEDVLAGISVDGVAAYDGATQTWYLYSPGAPSDLTEITHGKGYWVKVSDPCTLTIEGS